ncbi:MAG TPA: hypothetical protein VK892_21710, partial [Pyrinomonadaceae bacterium]|nr:hypothetical protein [Pyrinomonadaceae bacterium]
MKKFYLIIAAVLFFAPQAFSQKGVDKQTEKIREEGNNKTVTRSNDATRSIDWGRDKTKTRQPLSNP